ncbi:hypothetical protein I5H38_gp75 [Mycobacterium phage Firehouse51]|uniref:Uncharacterized protein n=1 Tax=Mycobacterium phage Firehouse51 TaxID=2776877 RepID=A0A7M1CKQ3_9CAUD|nr:hypothetical protein I5H38_gp75 [Mycobacterium phage Firehouse51]QOP65035.1 hypothetical protein SEA_FIREHOUSE51_75 [Mycobacterium phage Firehouse51]
MNNPELRAVLTEALSEALKRLWTDPEDAADQADWDALPGKLADAVASLPGVAVIQLPEPYFVHSATDDVNGYADWEYPHGSIAATDDGTIMWGKWHITDPEKVRAAAAALLAAAAAAVVATGEEE